MTVIGDARRLPFSDGVAQCVVTSPPYYGLRDYGVTGQIGLEQTPAAYVAELVATFREVRRVLRDDGVAWLNIGDSYASQPAGNRTPSGFSQTGGKRTGKLSEYNTQEKGFGDSKPKDLLGIPWRVAFALQEPYVVPTCVKSEIDRAWLAAIFDGEGCIGIRRFNSYRKEKQQVYQDGFVVYTVVANNDQPILDRCIEVTGFGKVALKTAAGTTDERAIVSRRDSFGWRLDGNKAVDVVRAIYPYLIAKRKQACIAYTLDQLNKHGHGSKSVPPEVQEKKAYLKELINRCNQREGADLPSWIEEPKQEVYPGWYLRSDCIWHKPNPMPESVTDRPTKAHEYVFLLSKQARYFYDAESVAEKSSGVGGGGFSRSTAEAQLNHGAMNLDRPKDDGTRNARTVWTFATQPYSGAHFATMPPKLAERCILAGTSQRGACPKCGAAWVRELVVTGRTGRDWNKNNRAGGDRLAVGQSASDAMPDKYKRETTGWRPACDCNAGEPMPCIVLDPFSGSGTTERVAISLGRRFIGTELNARYVHELRAERTAAVQVRGL